jgi:Predicted transcription factor, homolog of eukaryotic MBF1
MSETFVGARIRERRRAAGLRQTDLAHEMGISPSYLNLIERNRRRASPELAARAARALGLAPGDLDGALERRLAERLAELAAEPEVADLGFEAEGARDLLASLADCARARLLVWSAFSAIRHTVDALSDRVTFESGLAGTLHAVHNDSVLISSA